MSSLERMYLEQEVTKNSVVIHPYVLILKELGTATSQFAAIIEMLEFSIHSSSRH